LAKPRPSRRKAAEEADNRSATPPEFLLFYITIPLRNSLHLISNAKIIEENFGIAYEMEKNYFYFPS